MTRYPDTGLMVETCEPTSRRAGGRDLPGAALLRAAWVAGRAAPLAGRLPRRPAHAVELPRFVKRTQELGLALSEVEELLQLATAARRAVKRSARSPSRTVEAHVAELERRIDDRRRMRASLSALAVTCHRPRADRSCSPLAAIGSDAPLIEPAP